MIEQREFPHRHLLGIESLDAADVLQIIELSETFRDISERQIKKVPTLRGRTVLNLFFENSTRTRVSFELAAKRYLHSPLAFQLRAMNLLYEGVKERGSLMVVPSPMVQSMTDAGTFAGLAALGGTTTEPPKDE